MIPAEKNSTDKKQLTKHDAVRMMFLAPSNYGKSFQMVQFMLDAIKSGHFEPSRILIISPTAKSDSTLKPLIQACVRACPAFIRDNMMECVDPAVLKDLYNTQKQIKEKINNPMSTKDKSHLLKHYCLIIDDSIADANFTSARKDNPLIKIATSGRHFNISTLVLVQSYRSLGPRTTIKQLSAVWLGKCNSAFEIDDILKDLSQIPGLSSRDSFNLVLEWYHEAVGQNNGRGFLIIYPYVQYGEGRFAHTGDREFRFDKKRAIQSQASQQTRGPR